VHNDAAEAAPPENKRGNLCRPSSFSFYHFPTRLARELRLVVAHVVKVGLKVRIGAKSTFTRIINT
jgi:hypothetical protein